MARNSHKVVLMVTPAQAAELRDCAEREALPVSAWLRHIAIGAARRSNAESIANGVA